MNFATKIVNYYEITKLFGRFLRGCGQRLGDILFTVDDADFDAEFLVDMLGKMLSGVDTAVLTARTTETEHERGEATLDVTAHMGVGQFIDAIEEGENLTIVL